MLLGGRADLIHPMRSPTHSSTWGFAGQCSPREASETSQDRRNDLMTWISRKPALVHGNHGRAGGPTSTRKARECLGHRRHLAGTFRPGHLRSSSPEGGRGGHTGKPQRRALCRCARSHQSRSVSETLAPTYRPVLTAWSTRLESWHRGPRWRQTTSRPLGDQVIDKHKL